MQGSPNSSLLAFTTHELFHRHASQTTARELAAWHHGDSIQIDDPHVNLASAWSRRRGIGSSS